MSPRNTVHNQMRIWHRYLGFFLAGIMAVYAISGIVLIFRNTDFLKREKTITRNLGANLSMDSVGKAIRIRDLKAISQEGDILKFKQGTYNQASGEVVYKVKSLPSVMEKLTHLHTANSKSSLFFLNVFFGVALLFFVLSSFWMFLPKTTIFKKGLIYAVAGVIFTVILLYW